ncbi:hypothetical protein [Paracoccus methylarcula]|uniref:hypothetical protein n=1 Tax=Paracoccus methylarcula TaxID=72022 RepID=UPI0014728B4F|nr:hypothetical protein [Paracoccus methylarcula]
MENKLPESALRDLTADALGRGLLIVDEFEDSRLIQGEDYIFIGTSVYDGPSAEMARTLEQKYGLEPGSLSVGTATGEGERVYWESLDSSDRPQPKPEIDDLIGVHCFPGHTPIAMANGSSASIETLCPGDLVLAFDPLAELGRGALVPKRIVRVFQNETPEWLRLTWQSNGEEQELTVTPGHRFLNTNGLFQRIDEILEDDISTIVLDDGTLAMVKAEQIVWSEEFRYMFEEVEAVAMAAGDGLTHRPAGVWRSYNFEVEDFHTYVAGGVRVHNDSQVVIDFAGTIGRTFGTQLANVLLEDGSQFEKLLGGTVLGTITENMAEVITDVGYHAFNGGQVNFGQALERQLKDLGPEFAASLTNAATSLLVAELGEELGLDGFGAELFGVTGSAYAGSVVEQMANSYAESGSAFADVSWDVPWEQISGAAGAFFGSKLAHKILPAESLEGSLGGGLGSVVGLAGATSIFGQGVGLLSNFLIPGVGAFFGTLLGTLLGNWLGDKPEPEGLIDLFVDRDGNTFMTGNILLYATMSSNDGFPKEVTESLGLAIHELTLDYLKNISALDLANANIDNFHLSDSFQEQTGLDANPLVRVLQRMKIEPDGDNGLKYFVNDQRVDSPEKMVDAALTDFLEEAQPIGGDLLLKRAVARSPATDSITLAAHAAAAEEYGKYLEDRDTINALIAAAPDSAFAAGWAIVLAQAEELKLRTVNKNDFNGGLHGFLASLEEAGLAVNPGDVSIGRDANNRVTIELAVDRQDAVPETAFVAAQNVKYVETSSGGKLQFAFNNSMGAVGYTDVTGKVVDGARIAVQGETTGRDFWIAPDDRSFVFEDVGTHTIKVGQAEIESSDDILIGRDGNDIIRAGTGWDWVQGGNGNDLLRGGEQADTLFGGNGKDTLYGEQGLDYLEGGAGGDVISGAGHEQSGGIITVYDGDTAGYTQSNAAVGINLDLGTARGGHAEGDKLTYILNLVGSRYDDHLYGNDNRNVLEGGAGADTLNGGPGTEFPDFASYARASVAVYASLADPSRNTGDAKGDVYRSIEGLLGSANGDTLVGDGGDNFLWGEGGDDLLLPGRGVNGILGGFGLDLLSYRTLNNALTINLGNWKNSSADVANDTVYDVEAYQATKYDDTLIGSAQGDILLGFNGNDHLRGLQGGDALNGEAGNDTLDGGEGTDTLTGGIGNDVYIVDNAGDRVIEAVSGGTDRIHTSVSIDLDKANSSYYGNVETVTMAGSADLSARGSSGNNSLTGNAGNNILDGRSGNDSLDGGLGNDTIIGSWGVDTINGGAGNDTFSFTGSSSSVSIDLITNNHTGFAAETLIHEVENIAAGSGNDTLRGTSGGNILDGGAGSDLFIATGGAGDKLIGGTGRDTVSYQNASSGVLVDFLNPGENTGVADGDTYVGIEDLFGSAQNDQLRGNNSNNSIRGGDGHDRLEGRNGTDWLRGENGNDTLDGGAGADNLIGGTGNDVYVIDNTGDRISELANEGRDRVHASISIDLAGNEGAYANNEIVTLSGSDNLFAYGNAAANSLVGNSGNNRIAGRAGDDTLTGGADADRFIFRNGYDRDVIQDFENNVDTIEVTGFGVSNFTQARSHATQVGNDVIFDFGGDDVLTVRNITISALADDMVFS